MRKACHIHEDETVYSQQQWKQYSQFCMETRKLSAFPRGLNIKIIVRLLVRRKIVGGSWPKEIRSINPSDLDREICAPSEQDVSAGGKRKKRGRRRERREKGETKMEKGREKWRRKEHHRENIGKGE